MMDSRSLARLQTVKARLERVRVAELADATAERDIAARRRDATAREAAELARPLYETGLRSVREQSELAYLAGRARQDLVAAEQELLGREARRDERVVAVNGARREVLGLERARDRVLEREARDAERREQNVDDDRSAQRWRSR